MAWRSCQFPGWSPRWRPSSDWSPVGPRPFPDWSPAGWRPFPARWRPLPDSVPVEWNPFPGWLVTAGNVYAMVVNNNKINPFFTVGAFVQ